MTIQSYPLIEHFDYMWRYVPQPFIIPVGNVKSIKKTIEGSFVISTTDNNEYDLVPSALRKLVSALGVQVKLLYAICDENDVMDLILPAVEKLFKCYSSCIVFYATSSEPYTIIDLNVNEAKGETGTPYENSPSPWQVSPDEFPSNYTCFRNFLDQQQIKSDDASVLVKAENLMPSKSTVEIKLFKETDNPIVPMVKYKSRFSNMKGFSDVRVVLYDTVSEVSVVMPVSYKSEDVSLDTMLKHATHYRDKFDMNDYIFREINEILASPQTSVDTIKFINFLTDEGIANLNQPIKNLIEEVKQNIRSFNANRKAKVLANLGSLIGLAFMRKHKSCRTCGHMDL